MTIPKFLYKYQPANEKTIANLEHQILWFSKPSTFNDPYDCAITPVVDLSDEECEEWFDSCWKRAITEDSKIFYEQNKNNKVKAARERLEDEAHILLDEKKREILSSWGVACFAEQKDVMLMWSHYADGHKGFCLKFDTSADFFRNLLPINYIKEFPSVNIGQALLGKEFPDILRPMIKTKARYWKYEREWRALRPVGGQGYSYETNCLKGVYFGVAIDSHYKQLIKQIMQGSSTALYDMVKSEEKFHLGWRIHKVL